MHVVSSNNHVVVVFIYENMTLFLQRVIKKEQYTNCLTVFNVFSNFHYFEAISKFIKKLIIALLARVICRVKADKQNLSEEQKCQIQHFKCDLISKAK